MRSKWRLAGYVCAAVLLHEGTAIAANVEISANDIGGQVVGAGGPEAGVWVIAETSDLPTKYAKVVVTDEQGRFVIPELPAANYTVWVRGYGVQDTARQQARPGHLLDFKTAAASPKQDAQNYPGMYWYAMLDIPKPEEFPGTGAKGNKMPETMKSQSQWVDTVKNMCQSCHALGSRGIREIPTLFMEGHDSQTAWAMRTQAGQAQEYMATVLASMGPDKVYELFAKWTDRIAAGELPFDRPDRPKGIERNVVYTMWDWAAPTRYQHDA
ncbi:carboxypeptidase-like regulatory domain-containing protein, partial [Bradyrhizobium sp. STM 3809]|uniref:carboxypeptidase-like regulatory domain-containing protein n=1 Tax=Bradyrhizobium sp. STM 3809 TaxID=551936 RepID=UPI0005549844